MNRTKKIQQLLVSHLLDHGSIELTLPDGMVVELGIERENNRGYLEKDENYCWLVASQKNRTVLMDSYNFGLRYPDKIVIIDDSTEDQNGECVRILTAV